GIDGRKSFPQSSSSWLHGRVTAMSALPARESTAWIRWRCRCHLPKSGTFWSPGRLPRNFRRCPLTPSPSFGLTELHERDLVSYEPEVRMNPAPHHRTLPVFFTRSTPNLFCLNQNLKS